MTDSKKNSGWKNSGNYNIGNYNIGNYNSGSNNSGNYNTGNYNSGSNNSGCYNSGNYNTGFFNTDEPNVRLFNKDTDKKRSELNIPYIELKITEWISEDKMTKEQKKADPNYSTNEGTLIKRSYKEAWQLAWLSMDKKTKQLFFDLPNFDAAIFLEITGVNVEAKKEGCNGKVVEIDGKKYKLSEIE